MMNKTCVRCKRSLPLSEFGRNAWREDKKDYYCRKCKLAIDGERRQAKLERDVRRLYEGRCVICDTQENLEIIPTLETWRRNPRAMVLICSSCKRQGVPTMSKYLRDCVRCGHKWIAMKPNTIRCPSCGSPYWHTPKREVKI